MAKKKTEAARVPEEETPRSYFEEALARKDAGLDQALRPPSAPKTSSRASLCR